MISLTAQGIAEAAKGSQNQDKIEEEGEEEEDGISDVAARGESSHQHPKLYMQEHMEDVDDEEDEEDDDDVFEPFWLKIISGMS